jgi:hypothetical protein
MVLQICVRLKPRQRLGRLAITPVSERRYFAKLVMGQFDRILPEPHEAI